MLRTDFREEWNDIIAVLSEFRLLKSHISVGGGGKSQVSGWIDKQFTARGWHERKFATQIRVDENVIDSPTHNVDCFKTGVGVEIEWNLSALFNLRQNSFYAKEKARRAICASRKNASESHVTDVSTHLRSG